MEMILEFYDKLGQELHWIAIKWSAEIYARLLMNGHMLTLKETMFMKDAITIALIALVFILHLWILNKIIGIIKWLFRSKKRA